MSGFRTVNGLILHPNGAVWAGATVRFRLTDDAYLLSPPSTYPPATIRVVTESDGTFRTTLASGLSATYEVTLPDDERFTIIIEDGTETTLESLRAATEGAVLPATSIEALVNTYIAASGSLSAVSDTSSIDLTKTGGTLSAAAIFGTTAGTVAQGNHSHVRAVTYMFGDGVNQLSTGRQLRDLYIPSGMVLTPIEWTLLADPAGALVMTIWGDTYANHPPTAADILTGSAPPTIPATGFKAQSSTLTGWTSPWTGPLVLRFNVVSVATITNGSLTIKFSVVG